MSCKRSDCAHSNGRCTCGNTHKNCPFCPTFGRAAHGTRPPVGHPPRYPVPSPAPLPVSGGFLISVPAHMGAVAGVIPLNCGKCGGFGHSSTDHCGTCGRTDHRKCCTICYLSGHTDSDHCTQCGRIGHNMLYCPQRIQVVQNVQGVYAVGASPAIHMVGVRQPILVVQHSAGGSGAHFGGSSAGYGTWSCPSCRFGNSGSHCNSCGLRRPF